MTSSNPQTGIPKFALDMLNPQNHLDSRLTFSRAGNATMYDATGKLVWAPSNMFLNSATLATQSVTVVVGQSYTMSAYGTGSVALSAGASGTWTGTGVGDRVSLAFTATTTTATFTVTGSVTSAQLEPTSYNSPQPYIQTTSAAYYGPRFDHDPSTLALRGLLMEESRLNRLQRSEEFDAAIWASGTPAKNVTKDSIIAPNGFIVGDNLEGQVKQLSVIPSAGTYTFSVFAKTGTSNVLIISIDGGAGNGSFDVTAGTVLSGTATTKQIQYVGNGWYRCVITGTTTVEASVYITVSSGNINIFGAQLEAGSFATSYIPTYGATATRAADSLYTTNIPWFNATQGSFALTYIPIGDVETGTARPVNFSNGTTAEAIGFYGQVKTNALIANIQIGGTGYKSDALGQIKDNENKIAISYLSGKNNASRGGVLVTGASFLTSSLPTGINRLDIMNATAGNRSVTGWIKSFRYWNYALSSAQLQAVTKV